MATAMVSDTQAVLEARAASYHADVYKLGGRLTVQRVFPHAWHLRDVDGWIVTVTTASYDGPLGLRLEPVGSGRSLNDLGVEPGMSAVLGEDALIVASVCIALDQAVPWLPRRAEDAPPLSLSSLRRDLEALALRYTLTPNPSPPRGRGESGNSPSPAPSVARSLFRGSDGVQGPAENRGGGWGVRVELCNAGEDIALLMHALLALDQQAMHTAILGLLGRGPGLTPAGDDLLCGLMVGLQMLGGRPPGSQRVPGLRPTRGRGPGLLAGSRLEGWTSACVAGMGELLERMAPQRTTALSRTLLHYAARRIAVEPLLDVACTLGSSAPVTHLDELLAIGHSSGSDMLAGVLLAARTVIERETIVGSALVHPT